MTLSFINSRDEKIFMGDFELEQEVNLAIRAFCDDNGFKIPYWRAWQEGNPPVTYCDVGSHSEIFEIKGE